MPDTLTLKPWSSEPPTTPGVYRFRSDSNPDTVRWCELRDDGYMYQMGTDEYSYWYFVLTDGDDWWEGEWQRVEIAESDD